MPQRRIVMRQSPLQIMRRAMLPLDGSIAEHVPAILAAYAHLVPRREWPRITAIDFTVGSCVFPLLLSAGGVGRLVINDIAPRSCIAATALFGRDRLEHRRIRQLVTMPAPHLRRHTPSFHFASDYLTSEAADTFDRLFHTRLSASQRPTYQYLALRWVLGFVP